MKLKKEISVADIINATIAFFALSVSIYLLFYQKNRDIDEDHKKYTVKIEDISTERKINIYPPFYGEENKEHSVVCKKLLISNTGTNSISFIGVISTDEITKDACLKSIIDTTYFSFFLSEKELTDSDFINQKGKHIFRNKELFINNRTNIKIEPGESKYIFLNFLNAKWLTEKRVKELGEKANDIQYYGTDLGFKFNIGDIVSKTLYFDKIFINNFGGAGAIMQ